MPTTAQEFQINNKSSVARSGIQGAFRFAELEIIVHELVSKVK